MTGDRLGSVVALQRFPVKSLLGETMDSVPVGERAVALCTTRLATLHFRHGNSEEGHAAARSALNAVPSLRSARIAEDLLGLSRNPLGVIAGSRRRSIVV